MTFRDSAGRVNFSNEAESDAVRLKQTFRGPGEAMTETAIENVGMVQADSVPAGSSEKVTTRPDRLPDYWDRIMGDERLARARSKLSMHELRLLLIHAQNAWHGIDWLKGDEGIVIAYCPPSANFPSGRKMLWPAASLLALRASNPPDHLDYPATHWMLAPDDPYVGRVTFSKEPERDAGNLNQSPKDQSS